MQQNSHATITTTNEDRKFSFSCQTSSNLLDTCTTNDATKSSDPATKKRRVVPQHQPTQRSS